MLFNGNVYFIGATFRGGKKTFMSFYGSHRFMGDEHVFSVTFGAQ